MTDRTAPDNDALTFVGFGFGAIQAGLFVREALRDGAFARCVVVEIDRRVVEAVRSAGGHYGLNVASKDHVERLTLGPVEILDPSIAADREAIVAAIATASEVATALPSVRFFRGDGAGSPHRLLAEGIRRRRELPAERRALLVYTAENDNRAAEELAAAVLDAVPEAERASAAGSTRFLNTVIGKMSAVITEPERIEREGLCTVSSGDPRAFLVEEFRHILISAIDFPAGVPYRRGLAAFEEKTDLLPFEEAKLYGHNAIHALGGYIAALHGLGRMEELRDLRGAVPFLRAAFLAEAGAGVCARWRGTDALFEPSRWEQYAEDLLERMLNPHLGDLVERVVRDPERKLAWDDRLVGSMRLARAAGVEPRRLALGAAAALEYDRRRSGPDAEDAGRTLTRLWRSAKPDPGEEAEVRAWILAALERLRSSAGPSAGPSAGESAGKPAPPLLDTF